MNGKALTIKPDPQDQAALFQAAAQLSGRARSVFLEQACQDDSALRLRIEALLAAHDRPDGVRVDIDAVESQQEPSSARFLKTPL